MISSLADFTLGAAFNLFVALVIVRFIYYPPTQDKTYVFTYLAFNSIIYFVLALLTSTSIGVGVGFGLFAIFSVLRYRTDEMPIREMTYLFVVIALPVVNSVLLSAGDLPELVVTNAFMVALLLVLEKGWGFHFASSRRIIYEKIDLITPANRPQLISDLRARTGLPVDRVEIGRIDFLRDTAEIRIFFDDPYDGSVAGEERPLTSGHDRDEQPSRRWAE